MRYFSEKYQGSFDPRQGASGHGAELISVTVSTGDERQAMGNTVRGIFRMVRDKQQLCGPFANQHVDKAAHQLAVEGVQPLQRFIEDQQGWMLHQRADDKRQPLLAPRQTVKRRVGGALIDAENIQPLLHQLMLLVGDRLINADRVKIARQDDVADVGADPVVQMQAAADVADMLFNIPDGLTAAAPAAKEREIVAVALRMIPGDQAQQRRFTGAVGPTICQCSPGFTVHER